MGHWRLDEMHNVKWFGSNPSEEGLTNTRPKIIEDLIEFFNATYNGYKFAYADPEDSEYDGEGNIIDPVHRALDVRWITADDHLFIAINGKIMIPVFDLLKDEISGLNW